LVLIILTMLAGCSGADGVIGSDSGASYWTAEFVHEIGAVAEPTQTLASVGEVVLTADGLLLVGQPPDQQIRVYGLDGAFRWSIGARGDGPGEIGRLTDFAVSGDTLKVVDGGNSRVTAFAVDGTFLGDDPFERVILRTGGAASVYLPSAAPLADGSSVSLPVLVVSAALREGAASDDPEVIVRRLLTNGSLSDTVVAVRPGQHVERRDGRRSLIETEALIAADRRGNGAIVAFRAPTGNPDPETFRVIRVNAAADTVFERVFPFRPVPVPPDTLQRYLDDVPEERRAARRALTWVPESRPPIERVVQGSDGMIWLQREPVHDMVDWWAIDPMTGDHAGTLALPLGTRIVESRGEEIVTVRTDELDVEYLQRWRLAR
jgi:hypothetical protein